MRVYDTQAPATVVFMLYQIAQDASCGDAAASLGRDALGVV